MKTFVKIRKDVSSREDVIKYCYFITEQVLVVPRKSTKNRFFEFCRFIGHPKLIGK